jgi:nitroreductase
MLKKKNSSIVSTIKSRRSIRGFLSKKVPKNIMAKIFELAQYSPSNCNIQPWFSFVSSGRSKNNLIKKFLKSHSKGIKPDSDYEYPSDFKSELVYMTRQVGAASELYKKMKIKREDKAAREKAFLLNYKMYNAPHVCFIGMKKEFGPSIAIDVGVYVQTLMLAMKAYGVSSCAQGTLRNYPNIIRKELKIDKNINILLGISFGYKDKQIKANQVIVGRADFIENVKFFI